MKNKIFGLFIILGILSIGATIVSAEKYAPGEIIVNFHDNATEDEIRNLIEYYNLTWGEGYPIFVETENFKVYVELPEEIIGNFSLRDDISDKIIAKDRETYGSDYILVGAWPTSFVYLDKYGKALMVVAFNDRATEQKARDLIGNFEGLEIKEIIVSGSPSEIIHKWGVVKVPEGEEQSWIETFESESIVDSAELNYILEAHAGGEIPQGCVNKCGDGICGEIVCQGPGCPCAETIENCPEDCSPDKSNNLVYLIIGAVIIILVILFLILRKKK